MFAKKRLLRKTGAEADAACRRVVCNTESCRVCHENVAANSVTIAVMLECHPSDNLLSVLRRITSNNGAHPLESKLKSSVESLSHSSEVAWRRGRCTWRRTGHVCQRADTCL